MIEESTFHGKSWLLAEVSGAIGSWAWLLLFLAMVIVPIITYTRRQQREREDR